MIETMKGTRKKRSAKMPAITAATSMKIQLPLIQT